MPARPVPGARQQRYRRRVLVGRPLPTSRSAGPQPRSGPPRRRPRRPGPRPCAAGTGGGGLASRGRRHALRWVAGLAPATWVRLPGMPSMPAGPYPGAASSSTPTHGLASHGRTGRGPGLPGLRPAPCAGELLLGASHGYPTPRVGPGGTPGVAVGPHSLAYQARHPAGAASWWPTPGRRGWAGRRLPMHAAWHARAGHAGQQCLG